MPSGHCTEIQREACTFVHVLIVKSWIGYSCADSQSEAKVEKSSFPNMAFNMDYLQWQEPTKEVRDKHTRYRDYEDKKISLASYLYNGKSSKLVTRLYSMEMDPCIRRRYNVTLMNKKFLKKKISSNIMWLVTHSNNKWYYSDNLHLKLDHRPAHLAKIIQSKCTLCASMRKRWCNSVCPCKFLCWVAFWESASISICVKDKMHYSDDTWMPWRL